MEYQKSISTNKIKGETQFVTQKDDGFQRPGSLLTAKRQKCYDMCK